MNEEIEYAKMLEIPVSTINVLHKNKKVKIPVDLKEKLIAKVNEEPSQELNFEPSDDEINTVRVGEESEEFYEEMDADSQTQAVEYVNVKKQKRAEKILTAEFAAACALCGAIFLTNVFMPNSAINTFFTSLSTAQETDTRTYADFELGSVVGAYSDIELELSETGVLSFTGEGCVYPVAHGAVASITQGDDGLYLVTVAYSDTFQGVIGGLDYV